MQKGRGGPTLSEMTLLRQVVSQSPQEAAPTRGYENGLRAINRLIREDGSWSGHERNVLLRNEGGTFTDISGTAGLDFDQDGRAFAITDYDHDGDPDIVLKSRTGPQLRLLRNQAENQNNSVSFQLQGGSSNRDAIGAKVTVQTESTKQTKMILGGSGFLSQHSKRLLFGVGEDSTVQRVTIQWPSGNQQTLESLPVNHYITVEESRSELTISPFRAGEAAQSGQAAEAHESASSPSTGTWLLEPYPAPDFRLHDLDGNEHRLSRYRGQTVLINFWATWCPPCRAELNSFQKGHLDLESQGVVLLAVSVDAPSATSTVERFVLDHGLGLTVLLATDEMVHTFNTLKKHLFDKNQDLRIPTSFLLNASGALVKVCRGAVEVRQILEDLHRLPLSADERFRAAIPFPGRFRGSPPKRNYLRMGTALTENSLVEPALAAFRKSVETSSSAGQAFYNIGSLYLQQKDPDSARTAFERALQLLPEHAETHNNLGALRVASDSVRKNPDFEATYLTLARLYLQAGHVPSAVRILEDLLVRYPKHVEAQMILRDLGAR